MSDRIQFAVSVTPIETLATENLTDKDIISSEVGGTLGGGGDSTSLTSYGGTAVNQGYLNGAVSYLDVTHSEGGVALSAERSPDFVFVKNTGHKYSSTTVLGAATTDCIMIVVNDLGNDLFYEIAWLKPGQAAIFPAAAANLVATIAAQFGDTGGDLHPLNNNGGTDSPLYARTYQADGNAATDGNALEYLVVT